MQLFIAFFIKLRRGEARIRTGKQRQQAVTENMGTVAEIKASVEQRVGTGEVKQRARKVVAQRRLRSGAVVRGTAVARGIPLAGKTSGVQYGGSRLREPGIGSPRPRGVERQIARPRKTACLSEQSGEALMEP